MEGRGERYMEKVKKVLDRIFIEGLSAMAHGLFASLLIGTILGTIGQITPGAVGTSSRSEHLWAEISER